MPYKESETIELKQEYTNSIVKEIIAFANTKGGRIVIGVDDDGIVTGVHNAKQVCESLSSLINDNIKPDITTMVSINTEVEDGREIVIIDVMRGISQPYYLASKGLKPSGVFVRLGNTSIPADESSIRQMIIKTDGTSYENVRSFNQDLHYEYAIDFFKKQNLALETTNMKTLGIINNDGLFTNLGLLLSDECQHIIKIAVFEDTTNNTFMDRKELSGSVLKQLTDAYDYLKLNNKKHSTYEGLSRIDRKDYDDLVLREALLNTIIHRDYSFSGSIIINIYSDRMEFVSIGGLVTGISLDDIMLGISQTRNEKLANIFYRLELVESYGTGIKKIIQSYSKAPVKPEFKASSGAFLLILPCMNFEKEDEDIDYVIEDDISEKILETILKYKTLSRKEIQSLLDLKQTRCITYLKKLEENKRIKKIGQGKNIRYKIK